MAYANLLDNYDTIEDFEGCQYLYSAILDENQNALNALVKKNSDIVYNPLIKYETVNIFGNISLIRNFQFHKKEGIKRLFEVDYLKRAEIKLLENFLFEQNIKRPLGYFFTRNESDSIPGELERRLASWDNLALEKFIVVKKEGKIVATFCPWRSSHSRRLVVENLSFPLKIIGKIMPLFKKKVILERTELSVLYLTHFELSDVLDMETRKAVFRMMMDFVLKEKIAKDAHLLSFLNYPSSSLLEVIKQDGYLFHTTPGTIYQVLSKQKFENKNKLLEAGLPIPGFELGIA